MSNKVLTADRKTYVISGRKNSDNEYNDYIRGTKGLHAQGSADIAIGSGGSFYGNNIKDRAVWNAKNKVRKQSYRRSTRHNNRTTTLRYAIVDGRWALNVKVALPGCASQVEVWSTRKVWKRGKRVTERFFTGKMVWVGIDGYTVISHEGFVSYVPKKFKKEFHAWRIRK